jgi:phosphoglycerate-specific signal transduction histidine kinase
MNINDYKIGTRLSLAFGIVLLLMTVLSAVAIYSLWQMNRNFSNISENSRNIEFANDVRNEIQKVNSAAMTVALVNDEKTRTAQKKILEDSTKKYQTSLVMLEKSTQSKEMKNLISKLKTTIESVATDGQDLSDNLRRFLSGSPLRFSYRIHHFQCTPINLVRGPVV